MKKLLNGSNLKADAKKLIQNKLRPEKIISSSALNIGKLVSFQRRFR
jgi:hypothetical protein